MQGSQFEVNSDGLTQAIAAVGKPIHIYLLARTAVTNWFQQHAQKRLYASGANYQPDATLWLNGRPPSSTVTQRGHIPKQDNHPAVLVWGTVGFAIISNDKVQDLLAFLAQEITRLNLEKQTETTVFLGWLIDYTSLTVDNWSLKTSSRAITKRIGKNSSGW